MKSSFFGLALVAMAMAAPVVHADIKIGYVNFGQLVEESPQAKGIADNIRNEFTPRQRELQTAQTSLKSRQEKLQKDASTMSEEQRGRAERELNESYRDLTRKQTEVQEDFNARRNEELSRLQRTLIEEVRTYAKAQSYDLIVADGVIYATTALDITPAILAALQARGPKPTAAPAPAPKPKQ